MSKPTIHKPVVYFFAFLMALAPFYAEAQRKTKKKDKQEAAQKPQTKDKSIEDLTKGSRKLEGLFTIYQDTVNGSIQMIINKDQIGKDYIYFSQIANGVLEARSFKGAYRGSKVFKINKHFDRLEFEELNTSYYFDPQNPLSKAQNSNISHAILESLKIEVYDKQSGEYLVKADDLFKKETFLQVKPPSFPGQSPTAFSLGNLDKDKTKIKEIKSYPKNLNVLTEYVYSKPSVLNGGSSAVTDARNVSIQLYQTFLEVPDNDYEIRLDDPRVGYFTDRVTDQTATNSVPYRDLIHRWNLVKKTPEAAISEPVEPITWWIENTTPMEWRETIKEGVLEWNKAFEKAGFKNAMVVKVQPDTATWDAGDIRYNVLRWTSSPEPPFGGYGPSFSNPRTGELLGADIMLEYVHFTNRVFYDKLYDLTSMNTAIDTGQSPELYCSLGHLMHENTMFGHYFLEAKDASDLEMERMKKESMKALIMHEVGHTLGLNHNMKASQIYSIEQLSDAEFIKGKALTGSVMDYAAINLTKDRTKQGQYYDMSVGPYDVWAIQFGYTPFKTSAEKDALLNRSTQPELVFGNDADDMRSPGKAIDPKVNVGDLSNDAIQYAINTYEIANDLMSNIKLKFAKRGQSYQEMRRAYYILSGQRANAGNVISRYIGGVYVDRAMVGQDGGTQPYTPVRLEDQKRAMDALSKYVFAPDAFDVPSDLYNYLALQRRGFDLGRGTEDPKIHDQVLSYQKNVLDHILHPTTLQRITDSGLYGNTYSLSDMMTDLTDALFKADIQGSVNSFRQNLQVEYTRRLIDMLTGKNAERFDNNSKSMAVYNLNKIKAMATPSGDISSRAHKLHLRTLIDNALKEIK